MGSLKVSVMLVSTTTETDEAAGDKVRMLGGVVSMRDAEV
jgi:hypothetical protein